MRLHCCCVYRVSLVGLSSEVTQARHDGWILRIEWRGLGSTLGQARCESALVLADMQGWVCVLWNHLQAAGSLMLSGESRGPAGAGDTLSPWLINASIQSPLLIEVIETPDFSWNAANCPALSSAAQQPHPSPSYDAAMCVFV